MANFASPNVFIQEVPAATTPTGVSASMMGVVGFTQRGQINDPITVNSYDQFTRVFGPNITSSLVPITVQQFFTNGGQSAVVVRVTPAESVSGTVNIDSPTKFTVNAISPGDWSNVFNFSVQGNVNSLNETIGSESWGAFNVEVQEPDQFGTLLADEIFENVVFNDPTASNYVSNVVNDTVNGSNYVQVIEVAGGNPAGFAVQTITAELLAVGNGTTTRFRGAVLGLNTTPPTVSASSTPPGNVNNGVHSYIVTFVNSQGTETIAAPPVSIDIVDQTVHGQVSITVIPLGPTGTVKRNIYRTAAGSQAYQLLTIINDNTTTTFTDNLADAFLGIQLPNSAYPSPNLILRNTGGATKVSISVVIATVTHTLTDDGYGNIISATTGILSPTGVNRFDYQTGTYDFTLVTAADPASNVTATYKRLPAVVNYPLAGGTDGVGVLTRNEITNPNLAPNLEGLYAFNKLQQILNVCIPDFAGDPTTGDDQVDYAANRFDRFIILTTPQGSTIPQAQIFVTNQLARNDKHAAVYYPWLKWLNTATGGNDTVPPLGAVAGVFARTDANKNVSKAPAGTVDGAILGAVGPEFTLSVEDRDRLFPRKINPIANSQATGFSVWGDRTLSDDVNFRYIGVTRLFMFIEQFCFINLQQFIFENNGPPLWTRVRNFLNGALTTFYNQGYFAVGASKSDSFFVTCDETNNTQADIDAGILNVDIGIAPNKPAEFIVVRFQPLATPRV